MKFEELKFTKYALILHPFRLIFRMFNWHENLWLKNEDAKLPQSYVSEKWMLSSYLSRIYRFVSDIANGRQPSEGTISSYIQEEKKISLKITHCIIMYMLKIVSIIMIEKNRSCSWDLPMMVRRIHKIIIAACARLLETIKEILSLS